MNKGIYFTKEQINEFFPNNTMTKEQIGAMTACIVCLDRPSSVPKGMELIDVTCVVWRPTLELTTLTVSVVAAPETMRQVGYGALEPLTSLVQMALIRDIVQGSYSLEEALPYRDSVRLLHIENIVPSYKASWVSSPEDIVAIIDDLMKKDYKHWTCEHPYMDMTDEDKKNILEELLEGYTEDDDRAWIEFSTEYVKYFYDI